MKYVCLVVLAVLSIHSKQVSGAVNAAFLKKYQEKVCLNEPTCNLTLTPSIPASRLTFDGRDCMCDFECSEYNDCCKDSEYFKSPGLSNNQKTYICHPEFKIYAVVSCPASYADATVKRKCSKALQPLDEDDTVIILPVTNKQKRTTYANAYCALCNGDTDFDPWTLGAGCGEPNSAAKKGRSRRQTRKSGVDFSKYNHKVDNILPTAHFSPTAKHFVATYEGKELVCDFAAKIPSGFSAHMRKCLPDLVAECAASPEGTQQCRSYTAVVYDKANKKPYRNRECAICNGVPADRITGCPVGVRTGASSLFSAGSKSAGSDACSNPEIAKKFC